MRFDLQLFNKNGAQDTINAMLQAQQRGEQNLIANKQMAQSDLGRFMAQNPNPASKGSIAGPTTTTPTTVGSASVPGASPYNPPKNTKPPKGAGKPTGEEGGIG